MFICCTEMIKKRFSHSNIKCDVVYCCYINSIILVIGATIVFLKNWAIPGLIFLYFGLFNTVDRK